MHNGLWSSLPCQGTFKSADLLLNYPQVCLYGLVSCLRFLPLFGVSKVPRQASSPALPTPAIALIVSHTQTSPPAVPEGRGF